MHQVQSLKIPEELRKALNDLNTKCRARSAKDPERQRRMNVANLIRAFCYQGLKKVSLPDIMAAVDKTALRRGKPFRRTENDDVE